MKHFLLLLLISIPTLFLSQNRFWVATSPANWNSNNWSNTSGGAPDGLLAPSGIQSARFDGNGLGNCNVDISVSINNIRVQGYTGVIDLNGNSFDLNGSATSIFSTGTFNDTPSSSSLNLNSTGIVIFSGTNFNTEITGSAGRIRFNGGVFNSPIDVDNNSITASQNANGQGGCTFNASVKLTNSGTNNFIMGNGSPDVFNGTLELVNSNSGQIRAANNSTGSLLNENLILNCTAGQIRFGQNGGDITLANTKIITIGTDGFSTGQLWLRNFTQIGATGQNLSLTGDAILYLLPGTIFNGAVNYASPQIFLNGATFNELSTFEKTGATNNNSTGGNTFVGNCTIINSGSGYLRLGNTDADTWNNNLTVNNTGSNHIYIAHNSAGNRIGGNIVVNNNPIAASTSHVFLAGNTASSLSITGSAEIYNNGSAAIQNVYLGSNGSVTVGTTLTIENSTAGTADQAQVFVANGATSSASIGGNSSVTNSGSGSRCRVYLGNNGGVTFNGQLSIVNNSSANNSLIYCNNGAASINAYNENVTIELTNFNSDGVYFGNGGGTGTLANFKTVTIGGGGFIAGVLRFRNFIQVGTTPQAITLTNSASFDSYGSTWNADVNFVSPRITTRESTYNGVSLLQKTGAGDDDSFGANVFNSDVTFTNSGAGRYRATDGNASDYNGDVTYIKSSTGVLQPTYDASSTYAGDININSNVVINFGTNTGRVIMDGTSAQSINDLGSSPQPILTRLRIINLIDEVTFNIPITVQTELDLVAGNINTTLTNILTMSDNATVVSVSDDSYVSGPMQKTGDDAFDFPIGKVGVYRSIGVSAPANTFAQFRAEFFPTDPNLSGYTESSLDPSIHRVSNCEFWILDRTSSSDDVEVTLTYDTYGPAGCSGVLNQADLTVARWDGSTWKDQGNGGFTGTPADGSVVSLGAITSFSPFTIATTTSANPLPVELVSFTANENGKTVDLNWETASEVDNDYFTIERSFDGVKFEAIDKVIGAGNSNQNIEYFALDRNPLSGVSYYRLKQTDYNGLFTYSEVELVNFISTDNINIYPNPVKDVLTVEGLSFDDVINIYSIDSKLIYSGSSSRVNTDAFSKGIYQLVINHSNGKSETLKFIK